MQTVIKYQDTALPLADTAVTLFNSVTAFAPGGSFHLLNQQWFQYQLFFDTAGANTGTVTGAYSNDNGVNWRTFYTRGTLAEVTVHSDEVYVGMFKDIRFQFTMATANTTIFEANLALNDCKPTSKVTAGDDLHPAS